MSRAEGFRMVIAFSEFFDKELVLEGVTVRYAVRDEGRTIDLEVHADRATARRLHPAILAALQPGVGVTVTSHFAGGSWQQIHPAEE